ncbi:MAG: FKBP-type peptidyl-prolyl cis-trans isomerase [Flavobacteriales bacterium]
MKKQLGVFALSLTSLAVFAQGQIAPSSRVLMNERDSISFFLGQLMGSSIAQSPFTDLNLDLLMDGFKQSYSNPTAVNMDQCNGYVQQVAERKESEKYAGNKQAGADFLANNRTKKGVVTTASGLQYEVMTMGKGRQPLATDEVTVHYRGTLIDGTQFDSSYDRNEPATFPLNGVIKGWTEGVQLMPIGSKFKFYIPYDLAYGEAGAGGTIPPFSTLIFEVELISIK